MKPKIGLKITDIFYNEKYKIDFDVLEIIPHDKGFEFNIKKILKIKKFLTGKDLSMHTQTSRIFSCNNKENNFPEFNEAELNVLKAEIIVCKILGVKELIIHAKQEKLTKEEKEKLKDIFKFAEKNKVEIIYESNKNFSAETCLDNLSSFPKLKYNLDLGHLNTAIGNKTLGMDLEEFIGKVKERVAYIHVHNNNGIEDEHNSLDEGTLDWKFILNKLDLSKVKKIIIEVHNKEGILKTRQILEDFFKEK